MSETVELELTEEQEILYSIIADVYKPRHGEVLYGMFFVREETPERIYTVYSLDDDGDFDEYLTTFNAAAFLDAAEIGVFLRRLKERLRQMKD